MRSLLFKREFFNNINATKNLGNQHLAMNEELMAKTAALINFFFNVMICKINSVGFNLGKAL